MSSTVLQLSSKHHGIALWPAPSADPRDPLRWPRWFKLLAVIAVSFFNFTANFAGAGFSVATPVLQMQFQKTPNQVNSLLTFNFLLLGLGNLFWVPFATKFGKRSALLISMAMLFVVLIWTAKAQSFDSFLAARCLSGFASSAGESIVPSIVSDIFFLHERAAMMSIYIITVSTSTAIGPLVASFVVSETAGTWRTFSWICTAVAGLNLILIAMFYRESSFDRSNLISDSSLPNVTESADEINAETKDIGKPTHKELQEDRSHGVQVIDHTPVSWKSTWFTFFTINKSVSFVTVLLRPLAFVTYPTVFWAVLLYGANLAAQVVLIFAFPSLLLAPPYLWKPTYIGLIQIAAIIGFVLATFGGGWLSDIITIRQIVKARGKAFPEQRLISLIPGSFMGPVGCIIIAFACANRLSWIAIAFGFGMLSFGTVYGPNIAITYVVDSYPQYAGECLVVVNAFKNLVAFIFLYTAVDWVSSQGWIQVYMIMFMLVTLTTLLAIPLYLYGAKLRAWSTGLYNPDARRG